MDQHHLLPEEPNDQAATEQVESTQDLAPVEAPKIENNAENTEKSYTFRWSYEDQLEYDLKNSKLKKRRGALSFAIVMALAFLACIALLVGVLIWNEMQGDQTASTQNVGDSAVADVAARVLPSSVLIEAAIDDSIGYGSGFILTSDGYVVTNYHVIQDADMIRVTLYSGKSVYAQVVGYSPSDDLAVLKINGSNYPAVTIGDSSALRVGDSLVAVGNPTGPEAAWSTTQGIVSALNREVIVNAGTEIYDLTMIQTDAALNPGNSGGPICNAKGEVVGIVTRKLPDTEGISFFLPINGCMELIDAIIRDGHANNVKSSISRSRPLMGFSGYDIYKGETYTYNDVVYTAEENGVLIAAIYQNSGAYGVLKVTDILVGIDNYSFSTMDELKYILYEYKAGDRVAVKVIRDGAVRVLTMKIGVIAQ